MAEPMHMDGIEYQEIKITGRPFELFLLRQLSWWGLLYVPLPSLLVQR